jgi:hypothetical protein
MTTTLRLVAAGGALALGLLGLGVPGARAQGVGCGATLNQDTTLTAADPILNGACKDDGLVLGDVESGFGIVLDCGGGTIKGGPKGAGIRVGSRVEGVTIVNCVVDGFKTGIELGGLGFHFVERSVVMNAKGDGVFVNSDDNVVLGTVAQNNGGVGFIVKGRFNELSETNVALQNKKGGIVVKGREHIVSGNIAILNGDHGISGSVITGDVSGNLAIGNKGTGVLITGGSRDEPSFVGDNRTITNDGNGLVATGEDGGGNSGVANKGPIACQVAGQPCLEF